MPYEYVVNAVDQFGAKANAVASFFKTSVAAAMAHKMMEGEALGFHNWEGNFVLPFYPSELLWKVICQTPGSSPRIVLSIAPGDSRSAAKCTVEVEFQRRNGLGPFNLTVNFPDKILGLSNLTGSQDGKSRYRGVFFNTTVGEHRGNLFDVLNCVSSAFADTLMTHQQPQKLAA